MTVTVIITAIINSITGVLNGLGSGLVDFFDSIFLNSTGDGLSTLAIVAFAFIGLSVGLGLVSMLIKKIRG